MLTIINEYKKTTGRNSITVKPKPGNRIRATDDPSVLPEAAPPEIRKYEPNLGPKVEQNFDPPLVAKWDFIVTG